ncbi:hypothetical protein [Pseudodesulfovibrio sp.]|uniref:hypothetical protein n=1 Tax=unclassified Pseudodesulfovibrio TaxID=2661612 RepID=UPI003B00D592
MADDKQSGKSGTIGLSTTTKRTLAKAGMATSLGILVATGLMETNKTENLKRVHLWSGFALVGFSYWHYSLYTRKPSGGA